MVVSARLFHFAVWADGIDVALITACALVTAGKPSAIAAFSLAAVEKSRLASGEVWRACQFRHPGVLDLHSKFWIYDRKLHARAALLSIGRG